jgi:hypothetical protein
MVAFAMFWLILTILTVVAFYAVMQRRRRYESVEEEPWRASLGDEEPLDWEAAQQAEAEWLREREWQSDDDGDAGEEAWR